MTELEILKLANCELLNRWAREHTRIEDNPDKEMPIAKYRETKYWAALTELSFRISELERDTNRRT